MQLCRSHKTRNVIGQSAIDRLFDVWERPVVPRRFCIQEDRIAQSGCGTTGVTYAILLLPVNKRR